MKGNRRRLGSIWLALTLGALTGMPVQAADPVADATAAPPPESPVPGIHAEMLEANPELPADMAVKEAPGSALAMLGAEEVAGNTALAAGSGLPNALTREVFGYLPYWSLGSAELNSLRYDLLSAIAYFGVAARSDGTLAKSSGGSATAGWSGWTSSAMNSVITKAHDRGVKVVLTVTMMAWDNNYTAMSTLLKSSTNRQRLIGEIASTLKARGADGVNLDFEPVPSSLKAEYTNFVRELKAGLANKGAGSHVTVATMAGAASWSTGYDLAGLTSAGAADAIMVMGYDLSWSGSARAGGVAPISNPYILDVAEAVAAHLKVVNPAKIIWGVPYYGRAWNTTSQNLNSPVRSPANSAAATYVGAKSLIASKGLARKWDSAGKVPWVTWWDSASGGYRQLYYDDAASLGAKYDLIRSKNMAGVGIWALGMDAGSSDLWNVLHAKFRNRAKRLAGSDRYATAAAISKHGFPSGASVAYLATGANFPDAMTGGVLAARAGGPVLLVKRGEIPAATVAELQRLKPDEIWVLGGTGVVSNAVKDTAAAYAAKVGRIAGPDRYATAAAVSLKAFPNGAPVAYLVTGANYPDALAAGVLGGLKGGPVLLVTRDTIPAATKAELKRLGPQQIAVIGGTGVVSGAVKSAATAYASTGKVWRHGGANRYETAAKISVAAFGNGAPSVYVATGSNFADALAAVPVAVGAKSPLLLVAPTWLPPATATELHRLNPPSALILGGTGAISGKVVNAMHDTFY